MSEYQKWYADNRHLIAENAHNHVAKLEQQLAELREAAQAMMDADGVISYAAAEKTVKALLQGEQ